jgi:lysophospholipase L1-like esterase
MTNARHRAGIGCVVAIVLIAAACAPVVAPKAPPDGRPEKRIVFVGDSFVHRSLKGHGVLDALRDELGRLHPAYSLSVIDAGVNGNRIGDILERLDRDVLEERPDAVVLYWDSDVSDVDERGMTPAEVRELRASYERDLRQVLSRLLASGAFVIMSGPTLIGERPHGHNAKDAQLDAYRRINRRVARSLGIRYVDTRRAFFAARPPGTPADVSKGLLTEDGEHLNQQGALLVQKMFAEALNNWLSHLPARGAP